MSVDKSATRIRRMFGEISPRYDLLNHCLSGGADWYWRKQAVRIVAPEGSAPILDVCTGTGDLAIAYWKKARGTARVVGTDFTHEMLTRARQKAARINAAPVAQTGLELLEADTLQLPFPDDCFQIVSVAFGLRNVSDTLGGLIEMTRVCRPGGRVAVLEFSAPTQPVLGTMYWWYFRNVLPRIGQLVARNQFDAYKYLPQSVSSFPERAALAELMQQAGLEDVRWKPLTCGIATLYYGTKRARNERCGN